MKVVYIEWEDPCFTSNGWMPQDQFWSWVIQPNSASVSIGFLAYETTDYLVLLQSIGDQQVADGLKITRQAIKTIKEIGELPITLERPSLS